jgi:hypothetical protein
MKQVETDGPGDRFAVRSWGKYGGPGVTFLVLRWLRRQRDQTEDAVMLYIPVIDLFGLAIQSAVEFQAE